MIHSRQELAALRFVIYLFICIILPNIQFNCNIDLYLTLMSVYLNYRLQKAYLAYKNIFFFIVNTYNTKMTANLID